MRSIVALSLLIFAGLAQAQTFTVTPATGSGPRTVTWDVPGGANCQAGGAWTGAKAASGTQQLTLTVGSKTLTLTCTVPGTTTKGKATLTWQAPTQNTDGTPLTNLQGFTIHYGRTADALAATIAVNDASARTYTIENLDAGAWFFGMKALNTNSVESALSNVATKNVQDTTTTTTWTGTQTTDVTLAKPVAPVLTVQ